MKQVYECLWYVSQNSIKRFRWNLGAFFRTLFSFQQHLHQWNCTTILLLLKQEDWSNLQLMMGQTKVKITKIMVPLEAVSKCHCTAPCKVHLTSLWFKWCNFDQLEVYRGLKNIQPFSECAWSFWQTFFQFGYPSPSLTLWSLVNSHWVQTILLLHLRNMEWENGKTCSNYQQSTGQPVIWTDATSCQVANPCWTSNKQKCSFRILYALSYL